MAIEWQPATGSGHDGMQSGGVPPRRCAADTAAEQDADGTDAAGTDADGPVTESAKEVFAAALEKKKAAGQARSAHLDGHGGVGGATASHKATRTFRRKSG
jgi:hypothetical protein